MSTAVGLGACALSSLLFGSMFVPVKRHDAGNGVFVQWCMSAAILCVGMAVNWWQGFARFQPLAMLGGMFWAIGNATAVPIINELGIGLSMLIWGTTNCVMGWAAGRFGLFGIHSEMPSHPLINYLGLALVIVGGVLFSQIKPSTSSEGFSAIGEESDGEEESERRSLVRGGHAGKRGIAVIAALFAGLFYGVTFVPVIYIQDHREDFPGSVADGLPYVFAHYCGIFATATAIMVGYIVQSRGRPEMNPRIVGPSLIAGTMWAVAQSSWFVANDALSQAVTFPIISMVPGACAALWSVFMFRDIQGRRSLRLLVIAIGVTMAGALLVGISK